MTTSATFVLAHLSDSSHLGAASPLPPLWPMVALAAAIVQRPLAIETLVQRFGSRLEAIKPQDGMVTIETISHMFPNLTDLDLYDSPASLELPALVASFPALQRIALAIVREEEIMRLAQFARLRAVRVASVSFMGVAALFGLHGLREVHVVAVGRVTTSDVAAFKRNVSHADQLSTVSINVRGAVSHKLQSQDGFGAQLVSTLRELPALTTLDVTLNHVQDNVVFALRGLFTPTPPPGLVKLMWPHPTTEDIILDCPASILSAFERPLNIVKCTALQMERVMEKLDACHLRSRSLSVRLQPLVAIPLHHGVVRCVDFELSVFTNDTFNSLVDAITTARHLEQVSLQRCSLHETSVWALCQLLERRDPAAMLSLDIRNNVDCTQFLSPFFRRIAGSCLTGLSTAIDDADADALAECLVSPACPLRTLTVTGPTAFDGVAPFMNLFLPTAATECVSLTELDVSGMELDDRAAATIIDGCPRRFPQLAVVSLVSNRRISDDLRRRVYATTVNPTLEIRLEAPGQPLNRAECLVA